MKRLNSTNATFAIWEEREFPIPPTLTWRTASGAPIPSKHAAALKHVGATVFDAAPYFHEFILHAPRGGEATVEALAAHGVFGGYPLGRVDPALDDALLVCATDLTTRADVEAHTNAWQAIHRG